MRNVGAKGIWCLYTCSLYSGFILHVCLRWIDVCITVVVALATCDCIEFNAFSAFASAVHAFFKFFSSSRRVLDLHSSSKDGLDVGRLVSEDVLAVHRFYCFQPDGMEYCCAKWYVRYILRAESMH